MALELTVGDIDQALRRNRATAKMTGMYRLTRLDVTKIVPRSGDGRPTEVHVDSILGHGFEEVWNEFRRLYPEWFEEEG